MPLWDRRHRTSSDRPPDVEGIKSHGDSQITHTRADDRKYMNRTFPRIAKRSNEQKMFQRKRSPATDWDSFFFPNSAENSFYCPTFGEMENVEIFFVVWVHFCSFWSLPRYRGELEVKSSRITRREFWLIWRLLVTEFATWNPLDSWYFSILAHFKEN